MKKHCRSDKFSVTNMLIFVSDKAVNTMGKGTNAAYLYFQKASFIRPLKVMIVWQRINPLQHNYTDF